MKFDKQHGNVVQTLLKSERHNLYHFYWWLWRKFSWKKYLLVVRKILRKFVNIFTPDDKCFLLNRDKKANSHGIIPKTKNIFWSFSAILKSRLNFEHFQKKRWPSWQMFFRNYGLWKTWLNKCLKSSDSEDPSTSNMVRGNKHCWKLNSTTCTISIDHCESKWVEKNLS